MLLLVTCAVCRLSIEKRLLRLLLQADDSRNSALGGSLSMTRWGKLRPHSLRRFCTSESSLWTIVTVSVTIAVVKLCNEEPGRGRKSSTLCRTDSNWHTDTSLLLEIIKCELIRVAIHLSWQGWQLSSCTPTFCWRNQLPVVWSSANLILKDKGQVKPWQFLCRTVSWNPGGNYQHLLNLV